MSNSTTSSAVSNSPIESLGFQMSVLIAMQSLLLVNNITMVAISGLAGFILAESKWMATLPVTSYVLGAAIWAMPAAAVMRRIGRRAGYSLASVAAIIGSLLAWQGMIQGSLLLLCVGTFSTGLYSAFGASLRFAAVDVADKYKPSFRPRAVSLVLAGGILGGIIGPEMAKWSRTWLATEFAGTYLTMIGFALASASLAQFIRLPAAVPIHLQGPVRPLREILAQPVCWVAIACASLGYGVMNLLMVATPLAMEACSLSFSDAAFVLEWHIIGMFAPGLFTGSLISRFGVLPVIFTGALLMLLCIVIALQGVQLMNFVLALFTLGVGWNFMYTGGSTLLLRAYEPQEKNRIQGFMDVCVFGVMITTSASSGALLFSNGWAILNSLSLLVVLLPIGVVVWMASKTGWRFDLQTQPSTK